MNRFRQQIALLIQRMRDHVQRLYWPSLQPQRIVVRPDRVRRSGREGFTMIEIAISLAVIGFALLAIIGILPSAMNVQKENRQETIINQDASVFINAIRNGERGVDDLTNYVVAITNFARSLSDNSQQTYSYTFTNSFLNGTTPLSFPITNGARIVGLLSTPRYDGFRSNYVIAYVRSLSGLATEKFPQNNANVQDFALNYRLLMEVLPTGTHAFYWNWTNFTDPQIVNAGLTNEIITRSNAWRLARTAQTNVHDLRLIFRYPFQASRTGNGRQIYRTLVGGPLVATNEPSFTDIGHRLFYFQPHSYAKVNP